MTLTALLVTSTFTATKQPDTAIAGPETPIGNYTSFSQTLPNFGEYSQRAGAAEIARDFALQVLGTELQVNKVDSASNSVIDVLMFSDASGHELARMSITNFARDPRTSLEPVQQPYIVGLSSDVDAEGRPVISQGIIASTSLFEVQEESSYRLTAPRWTSCGSVELSLRTWASGTSNVVAATSVRPNATATLSFKVTNPTAAMALAICRDANGQLERVAGRPVGLIPAGSVPRDIELETIGDMTASVIDPFNAGGSAGSAELFARTWTGHIRVKNQTILIKVTAGRGQLSPATRCANLKLWIPGAVRLANLSERFACGIADADGSIFALMEVRPGIVVLLTDSIVGAKNFGENNFNQLAAEITFKVLE
jgi:hypothetical protein